MPAPGAVRVPTRGRPSTGARERILAAAFDVLAADGYAGLTTQKVASESGDSKALIHYHFDSKTSAGAEAVEDLVEHTVEGM